MKIGKTHWDLIKHTVIYGVGQVLSRLASILLLPLYTRVLSTADYGCIALLDLTASLISIVFTLGISSACHRYHFDATDDLSRDKVWWTGLSVLTLQCLMGLLPLVIFASWLAPFAIGSFHNGTTCFRLAICTIFFSSFNATLDLYFRAQKWSVLSTGMAILQLLLGITINVTLLVVLRFGVVGVFLGNFITSIICCCVSLIFFLVSRGHYVFDRKVMVSLWQFGAPLIPVSLSAMVMHQADRYILRMHVDLNQVGIYSLAYSIGQAVNSLILIPFIAIWNVTIYDIAKRADANVAFANLYVIFSELLMLLMFAIAMTSRLSVGIVAAPEYQSAADLVPIVCLAYIFFSLTNFYNVPALLAKQMHVLIPHSIVCAVFNVTANLIFVPYFGITAAAWTSVLTFILFAGLGLRATRRIQKIDFPVSRTAVVMIGLVAGYLLHRRITWNASSPMWEAIMAFGLWALAFMVLFAPRIRGLRPHFRQLHTVDADATIEGSKIA